MINDIKTFDQTDWENLQRRFWQLTFQTYAQSRGYRI